MCNCIQFHIVICCQFIGQSGGRGLRWLRVFNARRGQVRHGAARLRYHWHTGGLDRDCSGISGDRWVRGCPSGWGGETDYSTGGGGPYHLEGEVQNWPIWPVCLHQKQAAVVLICEDDKAFNKVAISILEINEAGQHKIRRDLHSEMHHPIEDTSQRVVDATCWLDDSAILGSMFRAWCSQRCAPKRGSLEATNQRPASPPSVADQGTPAWSLSRAAWQGSASTKPTQSSWAEGTWTRQWLWRCPRQGPGGGTGFSPPWIGLANANLHVSGKAT